MIFFDLSTSKITMADWFVVFRDDCRRATYKEISDLMEIPGEKDYDNIRFPSGRNLPSSFTYGDWSDEEYDFEEELRDVRRQSFESEISLSGRIISLTRKLENYRRLLNESKDDNERVSFSKEIDVLKKIIQRLQFQLERIKARKNWYERSNVIDTNSVE